MIKGCRGGEERMLREAARREFIAIITLDGLTEAALHTHCLALLCVCVCVNMRPPITHRYTVHTHTHCLLSGPAFLFSLAS